MSRNSLGALGTTIDNIPGVPAIVGSVPIWTGGYVNPGVDPSTGLPNTSNLPTIGIDPATGLPVIPGVSTTPGGTTLPTTPGGNVVVPTVPPVPPVIIQAPPSFWDSYGPTISAGLAVVGALAVGAWAYQYAQRH